MKDFEARLERLEALAEDIKREDIKIEDAIKDFEEGIKLSRGMAKEIDAIEGKIQLLMNDPLAGEDEGQEAEETQQGADEEAEWQRDTAKRTHARRQKVLPELSLFTDADEITGTSGEPAGGTRQ